MKNVLNLVKNEYIKLFSEKKLYIILAYIILLSFFTAKSYTDSKFQPGAISGFPPNMRFLLNNLNALNYLIIFSTDSIFGGTTQFSIMIVSLLAIDTFLYDFKSGNAKFVLASGISKFELTLSKYIYMILNIFIIICMFFVIGFIMGSFFFGIHGITSINFIETFIIYLLGAIPMLAFTSIIALISCTNINKSILTLISIMFIIIMGISDSFTNTKFFSPTGMLSLFNYDVPMKITFNILYCGLISFIYFIVTFMLYIFIMERKDIFI
ncbi:ABC transporter permease [Clostridium pasteurianum]|uniref:ABC-2 family transporter protein n=1 Tax=Clostridium pasteurianum BC1 TaxID=86416 RepID=R4K0M4_CLOPA|nr:ABC transporter permease [Clostridium pasteurianum]AGK96637.1 hypothetical protein Clopa_1716 [Clostridium pasteurianum BC1]